MATVRSVRRRLFSADLWRTRLWPFPVLGLVVALLLGVALPLLDASVADDLPWTVSTLLFGGGPEAARTVLSVIAGSLVTVTTLSFSLTVVTLQLASTQYSPRLLRTFVQDGYLHVTLALLLFTFTYAVTVLRTVRDEPAFVPALSVTLAFLFTLTSVIALVVFLAHLSRQIRVESLLLSVHTETKNTIRRCLSELADDGADDVVPPEIGTTAVCAGSSGFLVWVDERKLLRAAVDTGAVILLDRLPGETVVADTPIALAWPIDRGEVPRLDEQAAAALSRAMADAARTGFERTPDQDIAFGFRQIVDVTLRALSPGVNDPTTAVHALGYVADLLCQAAHKDLGPRVLRDESGRVRVVLRRPDLRTLLDLVMTQPRRYGAGDPAVVERLFTLLREVAWVTRLPAHHRAVHDQVLRLRATVEDQDFDRTERARLDALAGSVEEVLGGVQP
ncbi:DUF2254 domain-containing protein [Nonomuraea sp. NPDC047897]|uniref:DUF2254 domain-containing protein n=1 Tax=Nonomuraea sp. NPDC047897 TaxID=3364346 RepID=UPI00371B70E2